MRIIKQRVQAAVGNVARAAAVRKLVSEGWDRDDAKETVDALAPDKVIFADESGKDAVSFGASGGLLDRIKDALDRLASDEGQAKILKIVEFIMKLIAMLGPLFMSKVEDEE